MKKDTFFKSFIAGLAFPAILLPFVYTFMYFVIGQAVQENPFQFIPLYLPLIFGLTNVIYIWVGDSCPIKGIHTRLWVTGAILGFIVAIIGIFIINIPTLLFGLTSSLKYLPIIVIPIIYGAIFRYIIKWFNCLLGV